MEIVEVQSKPVKKEVPEKLGFGKYQLLGNPFKTAQVTSPALHERKKLSAKVDGGYKVQSGNKVGGGVAGTKRERSVSPVPNPRTTMGNVQQAWEHTKERLPSG